MTADKQALLDHHHQARNRLIGVLCVVGSALCFSSHSCVVRKIADDGFSTSAITLYVGVTRTIIACVLIPTKPEWRNNAFCRGHGVAFVWLVVFRLFVGAVALACMYGAYSRMPLGEATALVFTAPIWTTIMAYFWLGEKLTVVNITAAILGCLGVALIAKANTSRTEVEDADQDVTLGVILALLGSVNLATSMVATRAIGDRQPAVVSSGWYGFSLILTSVPMMAIFGNELTPEVSPWSWVAMFMGASVSFLAQTLLIRALQLLEAGPVNILATLEIFFSFTWQVTLLNTAAHALSIAGAGTIIFSALLVSWQKFQAARRQAAAMAHAQHLNDSSDPEHGGQVTPSDGGASSHRSDTHTEDGNVIGAPGTAEVGTAAAAGAVNAVPNPAPSDEHGAKPPKGGFRML